MSKLVISKSELKEFSVSKFKDFEGCPDALRLLSKRYGDRVDNLLKYKNDFLQVIVIDNKPHWSINFLNNLLTEASKMSFYEKYLDDMVYYTGDKKITQYCQKTFLDIKKNRLTEANFKSLQSFLEELEMKMGGSVKVDSLDYKTNSVKQSILVSLKYLMEDSDRLFTRSMTSALVKISEAQAYLDIDNAMDNQHLKSIAIDQLEFSEIF